MFENYVADIEVRALIDSVFYKFSFLCFMEQTHEVIVTQVRVTLITPPDGSTTLEDILHKTELLSSRHQTAARCRPHSRYHFEGGATRVIKC